jgi:hypothetical protein
MAFRLDHGMTAASRDTGCRVHRGGSSPVIRPVFRDVLKHQSVVPRPGNRQMRLATWISQSCTQRRGDAGMLDGCCATPRANQKAGRCDVDCRHSAWGSFRCTVAHRPPAELGASLRGAFDAAARRSCFVKSFLSWRMLRRPRWCAGRSSTHGQVTGAVIVFHDVGRARAMSLRNVLSRAIRLSHRAAQPHAAE